MATSEFWSDLTDRPTATFRTSEPFIPVKPDCRGVLNHDDEDDQTQHTNQQPIAENSARLREDHATQLQEPIGRGQLRGGMADKVHDGIDLRAFKLCWNAK